MRNVQELKNRAARASTPTNGSNPCEHANGCNCEVCVCVLMCACVLRVLWCVVLWWLTISSGLRFFAMQSRILLYRRTPARVGGVMPSQTPSVGAVAPSAQSPASVALK